LVCKKVAVLRGWAELKVVSLRLDLLKLEDVGFSCDGMLKELLTHFRNSIATIRQAMGQTKRFAAWGKFRLKMCTSEDLVVSLILNILP
jgi:hypothetical protein